MSKNTALGHWTSVRIDVSSAVSQHVTVSGSIAFVAVLTVAPDTEQLSLAIGGHCDVKLKVVLQ